MLLWRNTNGASTEPLAVNRCASARTAVSEVDRLPVAGSRRISLMPVQNEPNDSHHWPCASMMKFGSIALKLTAVLLSITRPRSVHEPLAAVGLVARKIAER